MWTSWSFCSYWKESERGLRFCHKRTLFICHHSPGFDDFSILASNNNDFKVTLMESLLINRDHPPLNKSRHSLPLELLTGLALDISKAFDRVWHASLFHKLRSYGIAGQIYGLISSFFSDRQLQVILDGKSSQEYPV